MRSSAWLLNRRSLLDQARGTVLEIGPGRGLNLPLYRSDVEWVGLEPARRKHRSLQAAARRLGRPITLHTGGAEAIPLPEASVDGVVATFVLCSVTDVDQCLAEIQRVLRPGAPFVFLEHVGAAQGTRSRRIQDGWARLGLAQCRPNRDTGTAIEQAGFERVNYTEHPTSAMGLQVPMIRGAALRAG